MINADVTSAAQTARLTSPCDVAIDGAGPAGLAPALFTCRLHPHSSVVPLDGAHPLGAKILVSRAVRLFVPNATVTDTTRWCGRRAAGRHERLRPARTPRRARDGWTFASKKRERRRRLRDREAARPHDGAGDAGSCPPRARGRTRRDASALERRRARGGAHVV